jgi:hypothetical protein
MNRTALFARVARIVLPVAVLLALLLPRLDWGFLSTAPGVPIARTAEPDEWHLLEGVLRMSLVPLRLDPLDRSWGDLSFVLLFALLSAGDLVGAFPGGFHAALLSGDLGRARPVLLAMRSLPVLAALVCVLAAYLLARRRQGPGAGLLAATLVAVSPAVILSGRTFVPDALQAALVALAFLPASPAAAGILIGLAVGAKYSAAVFLPAVVASVARPVRKTLLWAVPLGFVLGAPFTAWHARSSVRLVAAHVFGEYNRTGLSFVERLEPWRGHATNAVLYLVGPLGLLLAARGVLLLVRRAEGEKWVAWLTRREVAVPLLLVLGEIAWLCVLTFPVVRYELTLVPFLAVWAAEGLVTSRLPRIGRVLLLAAVLVPPLALSMFLVFGVSRTHPFESAALFLRREVRQGERVGRVWPGVPVLPGIPVEQSRAFTNPGRPVEIPSQEFLVNDDVQTVAYAPSYVEGRNRDYAVLATFGGPPRLFGLTWPRALTPHDARYASPRVDIWARRGLRKAD